MDSLPVRRVLRQKVRTASQARWRSEYHFFSSNPSTTVTVRSVCLSVCQFRQHQTKSIAQVASKEKLCRKKQHDDDDNNNNNLSCSSIAYSDFRNIRRAESMLRVLQLPLLRRSLTASSTHAYFGTTRTKTTVTLHRMKEGWSQNIISSSGQSQSFSSQSLANGNSAATPTTTTSSPILAPKKKKKARYSRSEKRERKAQREELSQTNTATTTNNSQNATTTTNSTSEPFQQSTAPPKSKKRPRKHEPLPWDEHVHQCIRRAQRTQSIAVENLPPHFHPSYRRPPSHDSANGGPWEKRISVVTGSSYRESIRQYPNRQNDDEDECTIRIQPLLILDLNGILCHRSRKYKEVPGVQLRRHIGIVAGTPVIPRADLIGMLRWLDEHFCLAVWTSAKPKTARGLIQMLVPPDIADRFLFVWAQNDCDKVINPILEGDDTSRDPQTRNPSTLPNQGFAAEDVIFEKKLDKVWRSFPLWNANNTLLIDDSPDKCPFAKANAIHPPPIHGQWRPPIAENGIESPSLSVDRLPGATTPWIADEENERQQSCFFRQYLKFWQLEPYQNFLTRDSVPTSRLPSQKEERKDDEHHVNGDTENVSTMPASAFVPVEEAITNQSLLRFLQRNGTGHMGWRGAEK